MVIILDFYLLILKSIKFLFFKFEADLVRFDLNIHGTKEEPINYRSLLGFDSHNVSRIRHIKAQISSASSTLNTNTASTVLFLNNLHLMTLMITILTSKLLLVF